VEAHRRAAQNRELGRHGVGDADPWLGSPVALRSQGGRRESDEEEQGWKKICAFCEQARHRAGISGSGR
jgi:hypothetical protein